MKRLFYFIGGGQFDSQKDFYKSVVEELKSCQWEKKDENTFICASGVTRSTFFKMTGIDYGFFEDREIIYCYDILYSKMVDGQFSWEVNFYENAEKQYSDYLIVENDDLGLFQAEEKTDNMSEEEIIKKLSSALTLATDNLDIDRIIDLIDNNFADVSNRMREIFCENLEVDDIGDVLKEDIARNWIEENPVDAYETAVDNMDSYEIKDKIIDYLSDNL